MRKIIIASTAFSLVCLAGFSQSTVPGSSPTNSSPTTTSPTNPTNSSPTSTSPTKVAPTNTSGSTKTNPSSTTPSGSNSHYANGADKNFHFGISVVPGLFWLSPGTTNNTGNGVGLGFAFGINLEFYFTQNYGFVTGLDLANIPGYYTNTATYTNASGTVDSTINSKHQYAMQYVEIPLLLKFRTLPIGLFRYFAIAGFNPGIRTSSKDDLTVSGSASRSASDIDINNQTSIIRLAYVFGAGVEYNIAGTTSLQGIISYDAGFLNVNTGSNNGNVTSKGITLTLGVLF